MEEDSRRQQTEKSGDEVLLVEKGEQEELQEKHEDRQVTVSQLAVFLGSLAANSLVFDGTEQLVNAGMVLHWYNFLEY